MEPADLIWMNGEFVAWEDAKVHVLTHGLHYGTGVFEGIRCYETPKGPAVFRLREHLQRLENSARLLYMDLPYSVDEIRLLLKAALDGRNGARWAVALALGLRQGEALGLKWSDVDLDAGSLLVRRGRLRPRWAHGCGETCGRRGVRSRT